MALTRQGVDKMTVGPPAICLICTRFDQEFWGFRCEAFPRQIPQDILTSAHDHRKAIGGEAKAEGQPLLFDPVDEDAAKTAELYFD